MLFVATLVQLLLACSNNFKNEKPQFSTQILSRLAWASVIAVDGFFSKENAQVLFSYSPSKSDASRTYTEFPMSLELHEPTLIAVFKIKMNSKNTKLP